MMMSSDTVFFNDDKNGESEERLCETTMAEVAKLNDLLAEKEKEITRLQRETHKLKVNKKQNNCIYKRTDGIFLEGSDSLTLAQPERK